MIHKSSVVDPKAKISNNVKIGPFCYVGPNVELNENVELVSNVHIEGYTKIGKGTRVFPFASIGTQPQDLKFKNEKNSLDIGENNLIREYEVSWILHISWANLAIQIVILCCSREVSHQIVLRLNLHDLFVRIQLLRICNLIHLRQTSSGLIYSHGIKNSCFVFLVSFC